MEPINPQTNSAEARLEKIESHLAYLEHLCDQLNEVVAEQAKALRRIQNQQSKVASSLEEMELERIRSTNPKPPHYQ
jgi:uncharacterized coiled-coil protein SlyX